MKKILVVDDNITNRKLLSTILSKNSEYTCIEAENGIEALNKLKEHTDINLILLDLVMPIMDGLTFLKRIKTEYPEFLNIPILVLTTDDCKKKEALEWGAREVIIKPINPLEILEKVSIYL